MSHVRDGPFQPDYPNKPYDPFLKGDSLKPKTKRLQFFHCFSNSNFKPNQIHFQRNPRSQLLINTHGYHIYYAFFQNREVETVNHLFFNCNFSLACWNIIGIIWDAMDDIQFKVERSSVPFQFIVLYGNFCHRSMADLEAKEWNNFLQYYTKYIKFE